MGCHCTLCQRWMGATSSAFVGWAEGGLVFVKGEDKLRGFNTSDYMTRYRCGECGTPVYGQSHLENNKFRDAPLGVFERDESGNIKRLDELKPLSHIMCSTRVPGITKADPDDVKAY